MRWRWKIVFTAMLFAPLTFSSPNSCFSGFKDDLQRRTLRYFINHSHPVTGLVRDRARNVGTTPDLPMYRVASLSATGFGLAVFANAAERGLISHAEAERRVRQVLRFVSSKLYRHHGWFYHFIHWESGERFFQSEVSTIDTALFLAGALYAAQVLRSPEITRLAEAIYVETDFTNMMMDGGTKVGKRTLSMGWTPELGYLPWQWDMYSEHLILILLGLGHPTAPLPVETWTAWKRQTMVLPNGESVVGAELPLFAHQYSHVFVDFRTLTTPSENFFRNSQIETDFNRSVSTSFSEKSLTYHKGFWGLSASGSPTGYQPFSPQFHNGTVCPGCAGASVQFSPCPILSQLKGWAEGSYSKWLWGRYGFTDSLNLDSDWFDPDVIGITVGPLYLSLANAGSFSVWKRFHRIPAIHRGIMRAKLATFIR